MSDDHDDGDEPGGLWDPDAFNPPPAPARPALHVVTTQGAADGQDRPADATCDVDAAARDDTLVRLEQFRPASETTHWRSPSQTTRAMARRAAVAGILAMAVAATAVGYTRLSAAEQPGRPAPIQRLGARVGADSSHSAETRRPPVNRLRSSQQGLGQGSRPASRQEPSPRRRPVSEALPYLRATRAG